MPASFPLILGADLAGVVEAVGEGADTALVLSGTGLNAGFFDRCWPRLIRFAHRHCGQTASYSLVFTPQSGFNGTITLACSGAPTGRSA